MSRTELRPELRSIIPARMKLRPIDERGYSIPWFVDYVDGKPDFRLADGRKLVKAVRERRCWLCGDRLGVHLTFCIGPMCVVNRVTSEPPCHLDCATYAVKGCPFLKHPNAQYRTANLPAGWKEAAGIGLTHNPTASALYTTRSFGVMHVENGVLFRLGEPESVTFWHRGQIATRAEVLAAIAVGFPKVLAAAEQEGPSQVAALAKMREAAEFWLPVDGTGDEPHAHGCPHQEAHP